LVQVGPQFLGKVLALTGLILFFLLSQQQAGVAGLVLVVTPETAVLVVVVALQILQVELAYLDKGLLVAMVSQALEIVVLVVVAVLDQLVLPELLPTMVRMVEPDKHLAFQDQEFYTLEAVVAQLPQIIMPELVVAAVVAMEFTHP